jgi:ADP-L-glycero-D-manno-heptose 6-epimerase
MIIVTGGAGFIGSNIVEGLNQRGVTDILVVDHLTNGHKMHNLADLDIRDYMDRDDFIARIQSGQDFGPVEAVFHQGACSATTEWNGQYMMRNNFEYSKQLLHWCQAKGVPFIYASSASVYGDGSRGFRVDRDCERPLNVYAYSKFQFDQYVRHLLPQVRAQIVGLRYFNVYGPRESHKGTMASTAFHFSNQIRDTGTARLFGGTDGYPNGGQQRDFVYVGDCVDVNLWFLDHPERSQAFTTAVPGARKPSTTLPRAVVDWSGVGSIEYIPFPAHLVGAYQSFTQAELFTLRQAGCGVVFLNVDDGVRRYLDYMGTRIPGHSKR